MESERIVHKAPEQNPFEESHGSPETVFVAFAEEDRGRGVVVGDGATSTSVSVPPYALF
jgi:hypothetical protein